MAATLMCCNIIFLQIWTSVEAVLAWTMEPALATRIAVVHQDFLEIDVKQVRYPVTLNLFRTSILRMGDFFVFYGN